MSKYSEWRWRRNHKCAIDFPQNPPLQTVVSCAEERCGAAYVFKEYTWSEWGPTHDMTYDAVGWIALGRNHA